MVPTPFPTPLFGTYPIGFPFFALIAVVSITCKPFFSWTHLSFSDTLLSHLFLCFTFTMANTHNQELENHINTHIDAKMDYMKEELKKDINSHLANQLASHLDSQVDSFAAKVLEKLSFPRVHTSSEQPSNIEGTLPPIPILFSPTPFIMICIFHEWR
jgi:hypothetical protein